MISQDDLDNRVIGEPELEDLPEGDGFVVLNSQGCVLAANLQAERILKLRLIPGRQVDLPDLFHGQYLAQAELAIREAFQGGHSRSNLLAQLRLRNGLPYSLIYSVNPLFNEKEQVIGVILTFRDDQPGPPLPVSGGHINGVALDTLFEHLAEGVFTINNRWRITYFNERAEELTGYKRNEVLGQNCWDIFRSDLCQASCPLRTTLETGVARMDQDVRIVGKHGRRISILVNTSVIKDKSGAPVGAVETFRPVVSLDLKGLVEFPPERRENIIGQSPALTQLLGMLPDVAASEASVVLEGESGTGKELFARAIHGQSPRSGGPFVAVNCSALAETLLESELFGHEKGAFTGAINSRAGRLELARGGTLFLDEVAEIKPDIQVKLLRVLEERVFERVGGARPIAMDARVIAATNRILVEEVKAGRFREDLYFRLRTVPLRLPPLRERPEDIPVLVNHFVAQFNAKYQKNVRAVDPKVMALFQRYHWPGNVRELQRALEYAFVFVKGSVITRSHLPQFEEIKAVNGPAPVPTEQVLWEEEKETIARALEKAQGSRQKAARMLGMSRSTLWRKMKAYELDL